MYRIRLFLESRKRLTSKESLAAKRAAGSIGGIDAAGAQIAAIPMVVRGHTAPTVGKEHFDEALKKSGLNKKLDRTPSIVHSGGPAPWAATSVPLGGKAILSHKKGQIPKHIGYHELGHHIDYRNKRLPTENDMKHMEKFKVQNKHTMERMKGAVERGETKLKKVHPLKRPFARHGFHSRLSHIGSVMQREQRANKYARQLARASGGKKHELAFRASTELPNQINYGLMTRSSRNQTRKLAGDMAKKVSGRGAISLSPTKTALGVAATGAAAVLARKKLKDRNK